MIGKLSERFGITKNLLSISFARFSDAFGNGLLIIVIPLYLTSFDPQIGIPPALLTGIVLASYALAASVLQPVFGIASDRLGKRKPFLVYGLLAVALASFAFSYVDSFQGLLAANAFRGLAVATTIAPAMAMVAEITKKETRGGSMGVYTTMRIVGFAVAPLVAGIIIETIGFNAVFILAAAMALLSSVMVQLLVEETGNPSSKTDTQKSEDDPDDSMAIEFYIIGLGMALMMTSVSLITPLEPKINEMLNQSAIGFSIAFSALTITRLVFQTPIGRLSDKHGRKPFVVGGLILIGALTILVPCVRSTTELALIRMGQGLASAGIAAPGFALAADKTGGRKGAEMSVLTTGFMGGLAAGPLLAGSLAGYVSFESPFWVGGILAISGGLMIQALVTETVEK